MRVRFKSPRSSPRTWGCFLPRARIYRRLGVFPTHVGVFPVVVTFEAYLMSLPHARGGVSSETRLPERRSRSSPRTWGCFFEGVLMSYSKGVFPTHVGVFLTAGRTSLLDLSLPHARGGVSREPRQAAQLPASSPRTWGCFLSYRLRRALGFVFPTHVGVFPMRPVCY